MPTTPAHHTATAARLHGQGSDRELQNHALRNPSFVQTSALSWRSFNQAATMQNLTEANEGNEEKLGHGSAFVGYGSGFQMVIGRKALALEGLFD